MKKLIYMVLFLPFVILAQTQSENYVVSKTYKVPLQEHQLGTKNHRDSVSTAIQYFDGLGRAKQSVLVEAGGLISHRNALNYDWTVGNTGSTSFYGLNGAIAENSIVNGTTPFGNTDLLWECKPNGSDDADGGWNSSYFIIDRTQAYRYSVWVKRTGSQDGTTYHGVQKVNNLTGTYNSNPYFWHGDLPQLDTWYLIVGLVHPEGYTGGDTGVSGVYDVSGNKVLDGNEFKWSSSYIDTRVRSYLHYTEDTSVRQYFWSPLFQKIDGSEIPLNEVINTSSVVLDGEVTKDIVTHYAYDELGRQTKDFLPFVSSNNNGTIHTSPLLETKTYYKNKYPEDFAGVSLPDVNPFSEKGLENSPLNRVVEQAAPGKDWKMGSSLVTAKNYTNGHTIKFEYNTNIENEVKLFEVSTNYADNTYTPSLTGGTNHYTLGELYKTITKDENWEENQTHIKDHTTEEFKNKQGQVLLKRTYNNGQEHDTYYVYDDFGNLTYVLPPKSEANENKPTSSELAELCYQYKYDYRNRLVEKKIPGKGWEYIVYDKLDRPVLTQDANLDAQNKWLFTKYDALGRVAYTGEYINSDTRNGMNSMVASRTSFKEQQLTTPNQMLGEDVYYTYTAYPHTLGVTPYTINYYDTYVDLPTVFTVPTSVYGYPNESITTNTKGLPTVSKVRVLGTTKWITSVTYYDDKARPVYVYSKNDYLETTDIIESKLDFTGKVLETKTTHTKGNNTPIVTIDRFEYDHQDRLLAQIQKINDQGSNRLVKNNYDELGQLESKLTGNVTQKGYTDVTSGISITDNVITKTVAISSWSAGLATLGSIHQDGYVEFIAETESHPTMVGLSNINTNANYNTIKYAVYLNWNNNLNIYESGSHKGHFGTFNKGDILKVERLGEKIHYKKNGETFYISQTLSTGVLLGDISMYYNGSKIKDLKIVDNSKGLQKVDYTYNVRGWLKNINQDTNNDNDLFNFSLKYNDITDTSKKLFNGNISQTSWNTLNIDSSIKTYTYAYDALNRITGAVSSGDSFSEKYDLHSVSYDKNGNILSLERNGHLNIEATEFGVMDALSYYYNSGNKLVSVTDKAENIQGFKDGNLTGDDYDYDVNGNMIADKNKQIEGVLYNHLNLPTRIYFREGKIVYNYDASGVKLEKIVVDNQGNETTTSYAGNYVYENEKLQFFNHAEGYVNVLPPKSSGGPQIFSYVYQYKDHLGNVRLSYSDTNNDGEITASSDPNTNEILDEKNYYPFGLEHKGYNNVVSSNGNSVANKKGITGKEYQDELGLNWYDFHARNYDAAIGRWMNLDPLAEKYPEYSPYVYTYNTPTLFIDPDGMEGIVVSGQPGNHKNKQHFLINGLDRAKAAQGKAKEGEGVTWIIYNDGSKGGQDPKMLKKYKKMAEELGITVMEVSNSDDIVSYVNNKNGGDDSRGDDQISSFYYVGHATPGDIEVGYTNSDGSGDYLEPSDFNSNAFASGAWINCVGGCRTAVDGDKFFEESVVDQFTQLVDSKSTVSGSSKRVNYSGGVIKGNKLVKYTDQNGKKVDGSIVTKKGKRKKS